MNFLILILLVVLSASTVYSEPKKKSGFDKFIQSVFPKKPKITPKPKKRVQTKKIEPKPNSKKHVVDSEWIARYLEQEAAWDYQIPDDDLIQWKDGKYHVPPVVFRHYEDMLNTPRHSPTPKPSPLPAADAP